MGQQALFDPVMIKKWGNCEPKSGCFRGHFPRHFFDSMTAFVNGFSFEGDVLICQDLTSVIIPVQAHYLPAKGMTQLMKTINKVKRQINPALKVDGVLLTLVDGRTNLARQTADTLRQSYGSVLKIYRSEIPVAIKAAEISAAGKSIYAYDKGSKVAQAYADFSKEVLADGEKQRAKLQSSLSR